MPPLFNYIIPVRRIPFAADSIASYYPDSISRPMEDILSVIEEGTEGVDRCKFGPKLFLELKEDSPFHEGTGGQWTPPGHGEERERQRRKEVTKGRMKGCW